MRTDDILQIPPDTLLAEELASEDVVKMANLTTAQTGVWGTILISTAMSGHGPRVKYFCSLDARNRAFPSLSLTLRRSWPIVCLVSRNKDALLDGPSRRSTTSFRNFSGPPMHYRHPCEGGGQQGKRKTSGLWIPACAEGCPGNRSWLRGCDPVQPKRIPVAGLGPAIHAFGAEILADVRRGCPGRARARGSCKQNLG
jgi:hypothetical protein